MDLFREYKDLYDREIENSDRFNGRVSTCLSFLTIIGAGEVFIARELIRLYPFSTAPFPRLSGALCLVHRIVLILYRELHPGLHRVYLSLFSHHRYPGFYRGHPPACLRPARRRRNILRVYRKQHRRFIYPVRCPQYAGEYAQGQPVQGTDGLDYPDILHDSM